MRGHLSYAVIIVVLLIGGASAARDDEVTFKVIVNPKNPIASIDRDLLRNVFLKKESVWKNGETMRPIDLSPKSSVHDKFTRVVLKKTPAQLKTYWAQQIFSGKGVPPPEAKTPADVIAYVLANPGAVGYVPADVDVRSARVVEVK